MKIIIFVIFAICVEVYSQSGTACITPNNETAKCISVYNCQVFLNVLKNRTTEIIKFLRASTCGFDKDPLVCCGTTATYQQSNVKNHILSQHTSLLPSKDVCGPQALGSYLIPGTSTEIDEFPWMALLEYKKGEKRSGHRCGGALISSKYILTAAHCVTGEITSQVGSLFQVRLGEYDVRQDVDCYLYLGNEDCNDPPQNIKVEEIIPHAGYKVDSNSGSRYHDIALVRLSKPVEYTDFIKPICLPTNEESLNDILTGAGWGIYGIYKDDTIASPVKQQEKLIAKPFDQCASKLKQINKISNLEFKENSTQVCFADLRGNYTCRGDSGGPIMKQTKMKHWYVEGILTFGPEECGIQNTTGVYTRVANYLEWIRMNIKP